MAGCGCSIPPDGGASKRNTDVCELSDGTLFMQMETALERFDVLAKRPLLGFLAYTFGFADRERQRMTGLEYRRLCGLAAAPVPEGLDDNRMVWLPIDTFRDLVTRAAARRGEWEAAGQDGASVAAA